MTEQTAASQLAGQLSTEVYELIPDGNYFIGPEVMESVATVLLSAFSAGLVAGTQEQIKEWGKTAGKALAKQIGDVFARPPDGGATTTPSADRPKQVTETQTVDQVEVEFVTVLQDAGLNGTDSLRIAKLVRRYSVD